MMHDSLYKYNHKITQILNSQLSKDSYTYTCQTGLSTVKKKIL